MEEKRTKRVKTLLLINIDYLNFDIFKAKLGCVHPKIVPLRMRIFSKQSMMFTVNFERLNDFNVDL